MPFDARTSPRDPHWIHAAVDDLASVEREPGVKRFQATRGPRPAARPTRARRTAFG